MLWALRSHWGAMRTLRDNMVKTSRLLRRLRARQWDISSQLCGDEEEELVECTTQALKGIPNLHKFGERDGETGLF